MEDPTFTIEQATVSDENHTNFYDECLATDNKTDNCTSDANSTFVEKDLPIDMRFNDGHRLAITVYSLLMVVSAVGNLSVLSTIIKRRMKGRLTRINMFLLHLVIADLLVTFLMMPLEITWNATVSWQAGDIVCRIMLFFRIFGLYLSGFVLICISLDRYFAVLKPLALKEAHSRSKIMLCLAWVASFLCSLPQSFIFHVEKHPDFPWYEQCVTFNSFPSTESELAYNFFGFVFLYGVPLIMIVFCYTRILCRIFQINADKANGEGLRRSSMDAFGRAKIRTLKMTVIIVTTFFCCWTPYNVMSLWYWIDKESAKDVDQRIQKGLFLFACTNSCVNPLIYGLFHFRKRSTKFSTSTMPKSLINGYQRPGGLSGGCRRNSHWHTNQCCIRCGSSGFSNEATPNCSTHGNRETRVRPISRGNSSRILNIQRNRRGNSIPNGNHCQGTSGNDIKSGMQNKRYVRRHSSNIPMNDFKPIYSKDRRESCCPVVSGTHNVIHDRNTKNAILSSVI